MTFVLCKVEIVVSLGRSASRSCIAWATERHNGFFGGRAGATAANYSGSTVPAGTLGLRSELGGLLPMVLKTVISLLLMPKEARPDNGEET